MRKSLSDKVKVGPDEIQPVVSFQRGVDNLAHGVECVQPLASRGKNPGDLRWGALAARVGGRAVCRDSGRWLRAGGGRYVRIADAGD